MGQYPAEIGNVLNTFLSTVPNNWTIGPSRICVPIQLFLPIAYSVQTPAFTIS
jgi:hypothetical protein